ncbi:MAG: hypothetical protein P4L62_00640 [Candidatus Pacebacteria bacterium]|nr:hypothetical protein [Candidatus Paceibacterota bacterium]
MNTSNKKDIGRKLVIFGAGTVLAVGLSLATSRPALANSWNHTGTGGHYVVIGGIPYDVWHDGQGAVITIYGTNHYLSHQDHSQWAVISGVRYYDQGQAYKQRRH